ncbi:DUF4038 domain-containing protein [Parabacteroides acidifaciens]|uniref:DUF4038 domain-containing protein n=1 Tax=Parabacteroides acidifaciens TaxID=2290935 RepID=A0A3D8H9G0_9BACT|nr:DUF4038 domain-containing protein [Parabacteroides acidifaciens]MBC8603632.1 DUF4038 domain-containing protein [Parabacteroides acidifaciens]RDU47635.1 DUF4038 domain-containing protein [Parabacteroides acidifaciens]
MKKRLISVFGMLLFPLFLIAQQRVIVDTDIDSDVDDAGTLAMLYTLHKQHKINLLGTIVTSDDPFAATCVSAFNAFYGMGQLPLGFLEGQSSLKNHSRYTRQISEEFPHDLASWRDAEAATHTYRKLLAESPDHSVVILTIGHLSSLQKLLQSSADQYSPLNGKQLVEAKVRKWYCMGGLFPEGKEANFSRPDPASTVYCLANWTKDVVFCGWEIGQQVVTGDAALKAKLPREYPMYRAYELYNNFQGRASWDQVTAFLLSDEASRYFELDNAGSCQLQADGSNRWIPGPKRNQSIVRFKSGVNVQEVAGQITKLMLGKDIPVNSYIPWKGKSVDFSHGPLVVSANKRFLAHTDGTPFFYMGDTAWELFHRLTEEEIDRYLENRRGKGFNVIQAVILAELDGLDTPDRNGNKPLINNDPAKPNETYFRWVDRIIEKAAAKGMYMGLLPTWGDKVDKQWGVGPVIFNERNIAEYGRFLANRYKDYPNIIWIIGGDRNGGDTNFPVWNALANAIKSIDKNHLMTFHPYGRHTSSRWFHAADWLNFNSSQTGHADCCFDIFEKLIVGDYNKQPVKPCINMEPCYEDHPVRGKVCTSTTWFGDANTRQALYWSLFSGAAGHTYGCHPIWQCMSPAYTPTGNVLNNWYDDLDLPGAGSMIHARRLFERYDYFSRRPAPEIILTKQQAIGDMAVAIQGDGYAFVYLPHGNAVDVSLEALTNASILTLQWYNPRTGQYSFIADVPAKGGYQVKPESSGKGNDWIFVMNSKKM